MRLPLALLAACAVGCSASRGAVYGPGDPLARGRAPQVFTQVLRSSGTAVKVPAFSAVLPAGYAESDGILGPPVVSVLSKTLPDGEATITVERYGEADGGAVDLESFARNLAPGAESKRVRHRIGAREFEAFHGLDFESFARQIPTGDPYADSLGAMAAPSLSLLDRRRFPAGGDAFRLYRCRKLGAWGLLGDYRGAQRRGEGKELAARLTVQDRKVLAACFGRGAYAAMEAGEPLPDIRKPSYYRLRLMALDERVHGAARVVERECVHLRPVTGGFLVLRLKAPVDDFAAEHESFEAFLSSFEPAGSAKP